MLAEERGREQELRRCGGPSRSQRAIDRTKSRGRSRVLVLGQEDFNKKPSDSPRKSTDQKLVIRALALRRHLPQNAGSIGIARLLGAKKGIF